MIRLVAVSVVSIGALAAAASGDRVAASIAQREQATVPADPLEQLVVPADRLPPACALAPRSVELGNGRVRIFWSLPKNPWIGTDRSVLASIRGGMWGPPLMPDGPPLSPVEMQRFRLRSADGVEAGYAAFYYSKPHEESFRVDALRFGAATDMDEAAPRDHLEDRRIRIGRIVVMVFGYENPGDCHSAVVNYLKSLAR